jgi:hypothetical protein
MTRVLGSCVVQATGTVISLSGKLSTCADLTITNCVQFTPKLTANHVYTLTVSRRVRVLCACDDARATRATAAHQRHLPGRRGHDEAGERAAAERSVSVSDSARRQIKGRLRNDIARVAHVRSRVARARVCVCVCVCVRAPTLLCRRYLRHGLAANVTCNNVTCSPIALVTSIVSVTKRGGSTPVAFNVSLPHPAVIEFTVDGAALVTGKSFVISFAASKNVLDGFGQPLEVRVCRGCARVLTRCRRRV